VPSPIDLPTDAAVRKSIPIATGVLDYFPLALAEVAVVSRVGNDQHNPGQPLHWDKSKSTDHADSLVRHLLERGGFDSDGVRHSAKIAWRALALLETELERVAFDEARSEQAKLDAQYVPQTAAERVKALRSYEEVSEGNTIRYRGDEF
jgi:hypothetical protein